MSLDTIPGFEIEQAEEKLTPAQKRLLRRKVNRVLTRDGRKVILEWAGNSDYLNIFELFLREGLYFRAKALADYLLTDEIPITTLRFRTYDYFEHLGHLHKTPERLKLALTFDKESLLNSDYDVNRDYLFYMWLDKPELLELKNQVLNPKSLTP